MSLEYGVKRSFRDIVHKLNTKGAAGESLLELLSVSSIQELRSAQDAGSVLSDAQRVSDAAALTLAAIKILSDYFAGESKLWNLVQKKSIKFVAAETGLNKSAITTALSTLKPMYMEFKN